MESEIIKETSHDIWSHGSGRELRDLLASSFCTLLLLEGETQPVYFSSPWMSDFTLFENHFREFERLFPALDGVAEIKNRKTGIRENVVLDQIVGRFAS